MSDSAAGDTWNEELSFRQLLDVLPAAAYLCDARGFITYFNRRAADLWGRAPQLNSSVDRYVGPVRLFSPNGEPLPPERSWMARALRDDREYNGIEVVIERPDGQRVSALVHANPLHDRSARLRGAVNILVDISDRKGIEVALLREIRERRRAHEADARLAAIVDTSSDAIIGTTLDGMITSWNRGAERTFGYTAAEVVGQSITIIVPADRREEQKAVLARIAEGERVEHFETARSTKDGRTLAISLSVSPIVNAEGHVIGASKVARDVTVRKRTEELRESLITQEQRARAEAESASGMKDRFMALLSHELRTPLSAVLGWTHMLKEGRLDEAGREKALNSIDRNAHALAKLVDGLLDISRVVSGKLDLRLETLDPTALVATAIDTVGPIAETKGVTLEVNLPDRGTLAIRGDANRLQQVIWNLLTNAVKFTPPGGRVTVTLDAAGTNAALTVRDTGEGIPPALLPHVFEQFRQGDSTSSRQHGGLGLGLAIVHHLVHAHGGTTKADSAGPGLGSTFTVGLPLLDPRVSAESSDGSEASASDVPLAGLRILVVDDDPDMRDLMHLWLEERGAAVTTATSAAEGLDAYRRAPADVLLADIGMPGQDGLTLMRSIRAVEGSGPHRTAAVAITAYAAPAERRKAIEAGFDAHVAKPVQRQVLFAALSALVSAARHR